MRKDIKRLQNEINDDIRTNTIQRMVQGSKSSECSRLSSNSKKFNEPTRGDDDDASDNDIDEEDKDFMEAYRLQRLMEIERRFHEKIFGTVDMVSEPRTYLLHSIYALLICVYVFIG